MKKILIALLIALSGATAHGAKTWNIEERYGDLADSTWLIRFVDGARTDSACFKGTVHQSYDTSLSIAEGRRHEAILKIWFLGEDSSVSSGPYVYDLSMFSMAINAYASTDSANKAGHYLALAGDTSLWADANNLLVTPTDTNESGEILAVMPDNWTAADTAAFQGVASGLDSNKVAQALTDVLSDTVAVNVAKISGSVAAANNTKSFFTGTGHTDGVVVSAQRMSIQNNTSSPAFYVYNSGGTAASFYTDHAASGENWSYGLSLLSGFGQSAPLRMLGAGSYTGAYGNLQGSVTSVTNKVTVADSTAGDISALANAGLSTFDPAVTPVIIDDTTMTGRMLSALTGDSIIGIDLDNVSGRLDSNEIAPNAINNTKLADNTIGASELADNCITSAELATTAVIEIESAIYSNRNDYKATGFSTFDPATTPVVIDDTTKTGQIVALMPDNWTAADTGAYQGSAAGLDSAAVYGAMAQAITDSSLSGGGAGTGIYAVNIYTIDTSGADDTLMNANIAIQTLTGSPHAGALRTNSAGYATFNLDADSFRVLVAKEGYYFSMDTIVVTGNQTSSILGRNYVVASPVAADLCRVYAWTRDPNSGGIVSGAVLYAIPEGNNIKDTCNNTVIVKRAAISSPSDADSGFVYLDLIKSKCLSSQNKYRFEIRWGNETIFKPKSLTVPDSATWLLTDE